MITNYEFAEMIQKAFEECKTKEEIDSLAIQMKARIDSMSGICKQYLNIGIL